MKIINYFMYLVCAICLFYLIGFTASIMIHIVGAMESETRKWVMFGFIFFMAFNAFYTLIEFETLFDETED